MKEIDVRTLACPGPVLTLREQLEAGADALRLLVGDELARSNVTRFATSRGAQVSHQPLSDGGFALEISSGTDSASPAPGEAEDIVCELPIASGPTVVQVATDTMGRGDDELGQLLMRSYLKTLLQLEEKPALVMFYNTGVRLCCEGSPLLEDLAEFESAGIEIIACATCLSFFELGDQLAIGRVTDMLEIATRLHEAGRVIRP